MKRGVKRVTVTDKMASETRGESYWDNWAQRRAEAAKTCKCNKFGMAHRPDQCVERGHCMKDSKRLCPVGKCEGPGCEWEGEYE